MPDQLLQQLSSHDVQYMPQNRTKSDCDALHLFHSCASAGTCWSCLVLPVSHEGFPVAYHGRDHGGLPDRFRSDYIGQSQSFMAED